MSGNSKLPDQIVEQHCAVVGKTGSGKTYTAKVLVERMLESGRQVCIIDPTGVWWGLRAAADGLSTGHPVTVFGGDHGDVPIGPENGKHLAGILSDRNLPCVIDLSDMGAGEQRRFMSDFAETLYRGGKGRPFYLVIDEADEFAPQGSLPEQKRVQGAVDRIVRRGRAKGFRVTLITQRPAVIHKNVLTQVNTLIAMRMTAPQDRNAIKAWVDGNADAGAAAGVLDSLASLNVGEGWVWAPEIDMLERMTFPQIATFDSSRTPEHGDEQPAAVALADVDVSELAALLAEGEEEKPKRGKRSAVPDPEALRREYERGFAEGKAYALTAINDAAHRLSTGLAGLQKEVERIHSNPPAAAPAPVQRRQKPAGTAVDNRELPGPMSRIVDAIAWWNAIGVDSPDRGMVAFVAGYSPKGSAFTNPLGGLRSRGLIDYPGSGLVALTGEGAEIAHGPGSTPDIAELHERVMEKLKGPQRRILTPLLRAYPGALDREDLAGQADYSPAGSAFTNPLGSLRSLGLIGYPAPGTVRASDLLFPGRI